MHRLANGELTLLGLGAVAAVLVLSTLARWSRAAEEKSTPAIATVDGMPAELGASHGWRHKVQSASPRHSGNNALSARVNFPSCTAIPIFEWQALVGKEYAEVFDADLSPQVPLHVVEKTIEVGREPHGLTVWRKPQR